MTKRKVNVSRVFALIALGVSLISLIIGIIGIYQVYSIKHKEVFTVQKVEKGSDIYFDGNNLVMCVDMTISNKGYENMTISNVKFQDQVFFGDVVISKVVYSFDTAKVSFNVGRQLKEDQIAYFTNTYGVGGSAPIADCYAFIQTNSTESAEANAEKYKTYYDLSFNTGRGSNYSQKVGK